jgi:DNA repair exonuclease SbcCD nuclease subunit
MTELKASLNMIRASRTQKQYREDIKDKIKEYTKEYNDANKEKIQEKKKEYNETNKEKIQEYNKEYRDNNKEQIKEKKKEKVTCQCGTVVLKRDLKQHEKTKKHTNLINLIQ